MSVVSGTVQPVMAIPVSRIWHRAKTWTTVRALETVCAFAGHQMGRHFTDLNAMRPEDGEVPWCSRCGLESAAVGERWPSP